MDLWSSHLKGYEFCFEKIILHHSTAYISISKSMMLNQSICLVYSSSSAVLLLFEAGQYIHWDDRMDGLKYYLTRPKLSFIQHVSAACGAERARTTRTQGWSLCLTKSPWRPVKRLTHCQQCTSQARDHWGHSSSDGWFSISLWMSFFIRIGLKTRMAQY